MTFKSISRVFTALIIGAAGSIIIGCCQCAEQKDDVLKDTDPLERAEDFGRIDEGVQDYLADLRELYSTGELNSVMVLKDGKVLLEYYDNCYGPDFRNICWSMSKTFTATAVGFAIQDGLLSLDDKLVDFLAPEVLPEHVSDTLAGLTVYNLLRMSSGFKSDPIGPTGSCKLQDPSRSVLADGFKFAPGEKYAYNSHNTYFLSVIVSKVTGKLVSEYLQEKLFDKLGIHNYHWDVSAEGYEMGGWGLYITTEALAKMGQFYLQKGQWKGEQLLNTEWFDKAMSAQIYQKGEKVEGDDHASGYGFQMWVNAVGGGARFDGAHGQFVLICPDKNAVIVVTENIRDARKGIKQIWEDIYEKI